MTLVMEGHDHLWLVFPGGKGCATCPAWVSHPRLTHLIDALPTGLLQQPPTPPYVDAVSDDDLILEVMHDLMEATVETPTWLALEALAVRIIDRIRNAP